MDFYPDQLFHIFNQGNNRRKIFFRHENYRYFLWKMRAYLLPFGDFISWCLMPNHFHWQFYVRQVEIARKILLEHADKTELLRRKQKFGANFRPVNKAASRANRQGGFVTLNEAIGILQNTYTRAINKERGTSGSLFRKGCKAKDGWIDECLTLKRPDGREDHRFMPGSGYAYGCMCYIHENPEKAGLVECATDWEFSSARDYAGLRKGTLCNLELGRQIIEYL